MDRSSKIRVKRKRTSVIWTAIDSFTAFIYSLFVFGRFGEHLSSEKTLCKRSFFARSVSEARHRHKKSKLRFTDAIGRSWLVRLLSASGKAMAYLKISTYGTYFVFYGIAASLAQYINIAIKGRSVLSPNSILVWATPLIISICALPLLFSGRSATGAILRSKMVRRLALDFFGVPEEKMKEIKIYGGKLSVLIAIVTAIITGLLTYYLPIWYAPIAFLVAVALFLVFANPEAGVMLTVLSVPVLQYAGVTRIGLVIMILITAIAYLCKLVQRRRTVSLSPELTMALLFCAFILAGSIFSRGGAETVWDAISYVVMILGGLFLTYNLISSEKGVTVCGKTLVLALTVCSVISIWNGLYNGISGRLSAQVGSIVDMTAGEMQIVIGDLAMFELLAVLVFPLVFTYATNNRSAKGVFAMLFMSILTLVSCWMCTSYEIVVALLIECLLFWLLYSHTSLTFMIVAAVPVATVVLLYPLAVSRLGWPDVYRMLSEHIPANLPSSAFNIEAVKVAIKMLMDGNLTGIGAGPHALETVLPAYTHIVSADAVHGACLWLQILCWAGVFGMIPFVVFIAFVFKRILGCFAMSYQKEYRGTGIALFCGIMVSLLLGTVTNIWYNEAMMYIFWVCVGLLLSYVRAADSARGRRLAEFSSSTDRADTEVLFYK